MCVSLPSPRYSPPAAREISHYELHRDTPSKMMYIWVHKVDAQHECEGFN